MPIDFLTFTPYDINYEKLMIGFEKQPIFDNEKLQRNYLNKWKTQLKSADNDLLKKMRNPSYLQKLIDNFQPHEKFQHKTNFNTGVSVLINFVVEPLVQMAKSDQQYSQDVNLNKFSKELKLVTWTPPENQKEDIEIKKEPIIFVHFYNAQAFTYLLIDGNHRVANAIQQGKERIPSLIIDPREMIAGDYFSSKFDKLFFIFQNEIYYLYQCKTQYQMTDKELLTRSYLSNQQFNFLDILPYLDLGK